MTRSVVIVGAGLGGMTVALCLQRRGLHVTVLEQASALGEVGAGVQVSANGSRVLHELGLTDALTRTAFVPERGEMRHWKTGETLVSRPLGATSVERYGFPYYHLHRADFHAALVQKFHEGGLGEIHLGKKVLSIEQDQSEVIARTESGETYRAQVLVGCDGIHSSVRASLFGAAEPRFTGCVAWRATIAVEKLPAGHVRPVASNWIGQGGHFVHYYLRRGELVNCVGVIERDEWLAESWSARGEPADFAADFAGWHSDLHTLIDNAEECFRWGLFDRDPLPQW
ncbi:MAG: FAD-dependent oxidoreductase, partial [Gammaproteobacteria bacterium]|nr:FAD-dependent oxidoreductase [Gammaproteobacteria bacterium]